MAASMELVKFQGDIPRHSSQLWAHVPVLDPYGWRLLVILVSMRGDAQPSRNLMQANAQTPSTRRITTEPSERFCASTST